MKKGFALISVLAALILITLGITTVLNAVASHAGLKNRTLQELKAQYLAEAGMQRALWRCRTSNCSAANETFPEAGTTIAIATDPTTSGAASYKIKITVDY